MINKSDNTMSEKRIEKDSMGEVEIDNKYLFGASTERARRNFTISDHRFSRHFIKALAIIKEAAAKVNVKLGKLEPHIGEAIVNVARDIARGHYDEHFVVDIFQTGSGTSTNMNFNEVCANLASLALGGTLGSKKPVHPNDHCNMGQSSNDVIPSALHVCACLLSVEMLLPSIKKLGHTLDSKAKEFMPIIKTGRTHLQDATPITLGQEFSGYSAQVFNAYERIEKNLAMLFELPIGGTAVGTGINTDARFGSLVCEEITRLCSQMGEPYKKLIFTEAKNHFEAQASKDSLLCMSGILKSYAVALIKIANDMRWLGSGPRCGLFEITLPSLQPGSSIMPGKVNPVIPEAVIQACVQVIACDQAMTWAASMGNFELNVMMPLMSMNMDEAIKLLSKASIAFEEKCVRGIEANTDVINQTVEKSLMLVTPLATRIGYDKASEVAKIAFKEHKTIRQVAAEHCGLSASELNEILDLSSMVVAGAKGGGE